MSFPTRLARQTCRSHVAGPRLYKRNSGVEVVPVALLVCVLGCSSAPAPLTDVARNSIAAEIRAATDGFREAQLARDPDRTIAYIAPDFSMYLDGARASYDSVVASIRRSMPALAHIASRYSDLSVRVLSHDAAVVSFTFRDSIVTTAGMTLLFTGPTTLVWERQGDAWRIVYADADHYPIPTPSREP
jgi:ketosteroid isomerase-like protein